MPRKIIIQNDKLPVIKLTQHPQLTAAEVIEQEHEVLDM
jgi:hypothetical protein